MKYYDALLKMGLFSKEDINQLVGNVNTAKTLLKTYIYNGYIERIRHNYYAVRSLETKQPIPNRYAIGSGINSGAYISHHSAFEYHGFSNQVYSVIYVSSNTKFEEFEYDDIKYKYIPSKIDKGIISPTSLVRVTDVERTIIDSIKYFDRIGGLEELLRCLSMVTYVDEIKLLAYLSCYDNQCLYQKTGYILSHFASSMKISSAFFDECKKHIKKSIRYLFEDIRQENPVFYSDWQLYAPRNLMGLVDEGGEELV